MKKCLIYCIWVVAFSCKNEKPFDNDSFKNEMKIINKNSEIVETTIEPMIKKIINDSTRIECREKVTHKLYLANELKNNFHLIIKNIENFEKLYKHEEKFIESDLSFFVNEFNSQIKIIDSLKNNNPKDTYYDKDSSFLKPGILKKDIFMDKPQREIYEILVRLKNKTVLNKYELIRSIFCSYVCHEVIYDKPNLNSLP